MISFQAAVLASLAQGVIVGIILRKVFSGKAKCYEVTRMMPGNKVVTKEIK